MLVASNPSAARGVKWSGPEKKRLLRVVRSTVFRWGVRGVLRSFEFCFRRFNRLKTGSRTLWVMERRAERRCVSNERSKAATNQLRKRERTACVRAILERAGKLSATYDICWCFTSYFIAMFNSDCSL